MARKISEHKQGTAQKKLSFLQNIDYDRNGRKAAIGHSEPLAIFSSWLELDNEGQSLRGTKDTVCGYRGL